MLLGPEVHIILSHMLCTLLLHFRFVLTAFVSALIVCLQAPSLSCKLLWLNYYFSLHLLVSYREQYRYSCTMSVIARTMQLARRVPLRAQWAGQSHIHDLFSLSLRSFSSCHRRADRTTDFIPFTDMQAMHCNVVHACVFVLPFTIVLFDLLNLLPTFFFLRLAGWILSPFCVFHYHAASLSPHLPHVCTCSSHGQRHDPRPRCRRAGDFLAICLHRTCRCSRTHCRRDRRAMATARSAHNTQLIAAAGFHFA